MPGGYLSPAIGKGKQLLCSLGSFCHINWKSISHTEETSPLYLTGGTGHSWGQAGAAGSVGKRGALSGGKSPRKLPSTPAQQPEPNSHHLQKGDFKTAEKNKDSLLPSSDCHGSLCPAHSSAGTTAETPAWHTGWGARGARGSSRVVLAL